MTMILANPLTQRRLQARTRLVVEVFDGIDSYGHDYGSYGHEEGDVLWWYGNGMIYTDDPMKMHDHILGSYDRTQDFNRGRYSPVNETISLIPSYGYGNGCNYNIPREVFEALELEFPNAVEVEIF